MSRDLAEAWPAKAAVLSRRRLVDLALLFVLLVAALFSGSLILIGEFALSGLILITELWSAIVRRAAHRGAQRHYEFGNGKLDQAGKIAAALAMLLAALWVASRVYDLIVSALGAPQPLEFAIAAAAIAPMTMRSALLLLALLSEKQQRQATNFRSRLVAAILLFARLLTIQLILTGAVLVKDHTFNLWADALGGSFVALMLAVTGIKMCWNAVFDLIDHPLSRINEARLAQLLTRLGVTTTELIDIRTRRSGRDTFVELTLDPVAPGPFEETRHRLDRLRRGLEDAFAGLDVAIKLHKPDG